MPTYGSYSPTADALTLLAANAQIGPRLFLLNPAVVFAARAVVLDPPDWPISFIAYDTVTVGDYTDVKDGMLLLLGSSAGSDDLGRQRVRGAPTTISIFVGRSSRGHFDGELDVADGAYITIVDLRMVWARMPFIDSEGSIFKDSNLEVGDRTTTPPPVAVMGQGDARTIDPDTLVTTVSFNGQNSYATADGATITDYLWDIADCTLSSGTLTDDNITILCPAGFRHISLTVTDSNGKSSTTARPVFADDLAHTLSFDAFQIESHRISDSGQSMTIAILEDMPRATYPDGTLAMIWDREPSGTADREHMLIIGWLDSEDNSMGAGRLGLLRDTTLTIQDVAQRLDTLPGFAQALADDETRDVSKIPDITWNYMVTPTMDKYMHYLLAWHSTALEVADFIWSDTGLAYQIAIKSSDGDSLWNQVWRTAQQMCPGYVLTCDRAGSIRVVADPQLQEVDDRTATVQDAIDENEWSDIRYAYRRAPTVHWLRTGALLVQASVTFNVDGTIYLPTVFAIAPGSTPGQGLGEQDNNEQLASSQEVLNSATGHRYARLNAATGMLTITLIQDDGAPSVAIPWRAIEPALKQWLLLTVSSATAARRALTFTAIRALCKEISIRYEQSKAGIARTVELAVELESVGEPALTVVKPSDIPAPGDQPEVVPPPIPPPDDGLIGGQALVAGIGTTSLYRTADFTTPSGSGGPTWTAVVLTADTTLTWVVDPFSPGYLTGVGAVNGWRATTTKLYRIEDIFGTVAETAVVTFATTALWRTIQASFGTYFVAGSNPWLICVSYYGNAAGHTGTWATYSKDGGATWAAEVQVSSFYDSGGASNPIGLYCSPKTPGLAYTAAHIETANPAETSGYVSTDWGATWTQITATEDPVELRPLFGQFDSQYDDYTFSGFKTTDSMGVAAISTGAVAGDEQVIIVAPPADTKRMVVRCDWVNEASRSGGFGSQGSGLSVIKDAALTQTGASNYTQATVNAGPLSGSFTSEFTFAAYLTGDWPANREELDATPPLQSDDTSLRYWIHVGADATAGNTRTTTAQIIVTVIEIELDSGVIYTPTDPGIIAPVNGQAGELHLPWENSTEDLLLYGAFDRSGNRQFALMRAAAGVVEDISPNDGSKDYGLNHGHFAVRCHDLDHLKVLLAGTGNDATGSASGDKQGVWRSSDGGDNWTVVIAPTTSTEPYSAAWSGSLDGIAYFWGPPAYFGYSTDEGASIDDRSGNLSALSATHILGIAGGPVTP